LQGLQELGWTDGRNIWIEYRWGSGDPRRVLKYAEELVALAPDVILAQGSSTAGSLLQATRAIPIVCVIVPDPVSAGFVDSLAPPGGNATGFLMFEYGISAKWLELLMQIAPSVMQVAVLRDPTLTASVAQLAAIQSVVIPGSVDPCQFVDAGEIERGMTTFAERPNGGLIVTASPLATLHRELIIALAARHKLPAVYVERYFVTSGGLISYGPHFVDQFRQAAGNVDRILKGENRPTYRCKHQPNTSLSSTSQQRRRSLPVPSTLLATADAVIE